MVSPRLRQNVEFQRSVKIAHGMSLATAFARGYRARVRFANMRREAEEAERSASKHDALRRRVAKVSTASRVIISCFLLYSASRRQQRRRANRAAVATVILWSVGSYTKICSVSKGVTNHFGALTYCFERIELFPQMWRCTRSRDTPTRAPCKPHK